jgi:hypothetical protein
MDFLVFNQLKDFKQNFKNFKIESREKIKEGQGQGDWGKIDE